MFTDLIRTSLLTLVLLGFGISASAQPNNHEPVLTFAVIGDAEPKPLAEFPGLAATVNTLNNLSETRNIEFVFGVGDLAHKATDIQYENLTVVLKELEFPFYPIMGNEEFHAPAEKFLRYAQHWGNADKPIESTRYVIEHPVANFILSSSMLDGREFTDEEVSWISQQLENASDRPNFVFVHGAQVGIFPEGEEKGTANPKFAQLKNHTSLAAIFSGDLHMDVHRVNSIVDYEGITHVHIPGLERTKRPDESFHHPYFRLVSLYADGLAVIETLDAHTGQTLPRESHRFYYIETAKTGP